MWQDILKYSFTWRQNIILPSGFYLFRWMDVSQRGGRVSGFGFLPSTCRHPPLRAQPQGPPGLPDIKAAPSRGGIRLRPSVPAAFRSRRKTGVWSSRGHLEFGYSENACLRSPGSPPTKADCAKAFLKWKGKLMIPSVRIPFHPKNGIFAYLFLHFLNSPRIEMCTGARRAVIVQPLQEPTSGSCTQTLSYHSSLVLGWLWQWWRCWHE